MEATARFAFDPERPIGEGGQAAVSQMSLALAARVSLEADQRVFDAELLLFEVVDDVVVGVGSALFGSDLGIEVCMLRLEGLKMWLCVHSQLSRSEVTVGRCLRRWDV